MIATRKNDLIKEKKCMKKETKDGDSAYNSENHNRHERNIARVHCHSTL